MLYKYLGARPHHLEVIENLKIRFTQPCDLNDPFEALPLINHTCISKEQDFQKNGKELMDALSHEVGVLALSKTNKNQLLWSHYAESHKGYVIAFDDDHDFFDSKLTVSYTTQRPVIKAPENDFWFGSDAYEHNFLSKVLGQKPIDWAYEEEVRLHRKLRMLQPESWSNSYPVYLVEIPRDAITGIYFGVNTDIEVKRKIKDACRENKLEIPMYEANFSRENYAIQFDECPNN